MNAPLPFALWSRDAPLVPNVPPDSPAAAAAASALGMSFASDSGPAPAPAAITAPFRCTEPNCAKAFQRKEHLTRHVRSNHIAGRPHQCHICNRSFARRLVGPLPPRSSPCGTKAQHRRRYHSCRAANGTAVTSSSVMSRSIALMHRRSGRSWHARRVTAGSSSAT